MGKIIAIANQKGGVGKTTTAVNLSAAMGERGHKTLLVDIDPQGNASSGVGIDRRGVDKSTYELLIGEAGAKEALVQTQFPNLAVLPSSLNLAGAELELVENRCRALGVNVALSEVWAKGGEGGVALAEEVIRLCDAPNHFTFSYELDASIEDKLAAIVTKVYHGDGVVLTPTAQKQAAELTELGFGSLPICMAKTQYSFSDNAALLGAPRGFTITVRNIKVSAGAGFLVALTGDIMTMPGLPKVPAAEKVDVDENGRISGLF